jgi:alkylation response protein AidB-like acyl-CoA dehydrogenase
MHIAYTPEQERLRQELRDYFGRLMTDEVRAAIEGTTESDYGDGDAYRAVVRQLGADGWLALGWPREYGGRGGTMLDQLIFTDEAAIARVPVPFLTINTVGPTIMRFGTPAQKSFYLPRIAAGQIHFSIGYSEPSAGTDLASLRTTARRDGDEYVIDGQKMWTSLIQYADYVWLACRTDPSAPRHKGLSIIIVPTDAEGFSWTPVPTVAGVVTSATYYSSVRVPAASLVGEENQGWPLITNQLNHERVALTSAAPVMAALAAVREWAGATKMADGRRVIDAEWVRVNLARVHAKAEFLKLMNWRIASSPNASGGVWGGRPPGQAELGPGEASATKVYGTEFAVEAYRLLMEVLGADALVRSGSPGSVLAGRIERAHRAALILTFGGGTNEVQRDIIAAAGLGLPAARRLRRFRWISPLARRKPNSPGWRGRSSPSGITHGRTSRRPGCSRPGCPSLWAERDSGSLSSARCCLRSAGPRRRCPTSRRRCSARARSPRSGPRSSSGGGPRRPGTGRWC